MNFSALVLAFLLQTSQPTSQPARMERVIGVDKKQVILQEPVHIFVDPKTGRKVSFVSMLEQAQPEYYSSMACFLENSRHILYHGASPDATAASQPLVKKDSLDLELEAESKLLEEAYRKSAKRRGLEDFDDWVEEAKKSDSRWVPIDHPEGAFRQYMKANGLHYITDEYRQRLVSQTYTPSPSRYFDNDELWYVIGQYEEPSDGNCCYPWLNPEDRAKVDQFTHVECPKVMGDRAEKYLADHPRCNIAIVAGSQALQALERRLGERFELQEFATIWLDGMTVTRKENWIKGLFAKPATRPRDYGRIAYMRDGRGMLQLPIRVWHDPFFGPTISLVSMQHFAEAGFYHGVESYLGAADIILEERGPRDEGIRQFDIQLIDDLIRFYYRKATARSAGLALQHEWEREVRQNDPRWKQVDYSRAELREALKAQKTSFLDARSRWRMIFWTLTSLFVNPLDLNNSPEMKRWKTMFGDGAPKALLIRNYASRSDDAFSSQNEQSELSKILLDWRDEKFAGETIDWIYGFPDKHIVVLLGAAHIPALEERLAKELYLELQGTLWLNAVEVGYVGDLDNK